MTRLMFVRHGESEANRLSVFSNRGRRHPLTEMGRRQAGDLAFQLRDEEIDHIYCSPLLRAVQTAQILGERLDVEVVIADALSEFDVGAYEGTTDGLYWQEYEAVLEAWILRGERAQRVGGGESLEEIEQRFAPFIEQVAALPEAAVLVGHAGLYRCMLPMVVVNVTAEWALAHPLANTGVISTIRYAGSLACVNWAGISVEPNEILGGPTRE